MKIWKELSEKSSISIILKSLAAATLFLFNLFITRYFSLDQAGLIFGSLSFALFISFLTSLGLHIFFLKNISELNIKQSFNSILGLIIQGFILVLTAYVVVLIFSYFLRDYLYDASNEKNIYFLSLLLSILMCFVLLTSFILRGFKDIRNAIIFEKINPYFLMLPFMLLLTEINANTFFLLLCLTFLISILIMCYLIFKKIPKGTKIQKFSNYKIYKSLPSLWIIVISGQFFIHFPVILASFLLESQDVALFSVSYNISLLIPFFFIAVNNAYAPIISELHATNKINQLKLINKKIMRIIFASSAPVIFGIMFFGENILGLFGEEYKEAKNLLIYLCLGQIVHVSVGSTDNLLNMTGNENILRNNNIISILIFSIYVILNLNEISVIDIAIALAIGIISKNLLSYFAVRKLFKINSLDFS